MDKQVAEAARKYGVEVVVRDGHHVIHTGNPGEGLGYVAIKRAVSETDSDEYVSEYIVVRYGESVYDTDRRVVQDAESAVSFLVHEDSTDEEYESVLPADATIEQRVLYLEKLVRALAGEHEKQARVIGAAALLMRVLAEYAEDED